MKLRRDGYWVLCSSDLSDYPSLSHCNSSDIRSGIIWVLLHERTSEKARNDVDIVADTRQAGVDRRLNCISKFRTSSWRQYLPGTGLRKCNSASRIRRNANRVDIKCKSPRMHIFLLDPGDLVLNWFFYGFPPSSVSLVSYSASSAPRSCSLFSHQKPRLCQYIFSTSRSSHHAIFYIHLSIIPSLTCLLRYLSHHLLCQNHISERYAVDSFKPFYYGHICVSLRRHPHRPQKRFLLSTFCQSQRSFFVPFSPLSSHDL